MAFQRKHIIRYYITFISCFLFFAGSPIAKAQIPLNNDLNVVFLKDTVLQEGSTLSFNRANITNNSSVKVAFGVELNFPEGWSTLLDVRKVFTIEPGQTLELPIRVAAPNATLSDRLYAITLLIIKPGIQGRIPYTYIARVKANSKWRVTLLNPDLKLDRINKETYFQLKVSNSGNITQELNLNFNTSLDLKLKAKERPLSSGMVPTLFM